MPLDKADNREAFLAAWKPYDWTPPACERCGEPMKRRISNADANPFWGCSSYPSCKATQRPRGFIPEKAGDPVPFEGLDTEIPF